jgi:exopolyphosphatase/guanosine-5'-triphosphate,3'-diphosphate pyrophosphatase
VIHSAITIARKYRVDLDHAEAVAEVAGRLFDELQADHRLGRRHRLLLRAAALMHEVGSYVSSRAHHKHSYYLIANSEVFGLTREERAIVALVGRYHRRAAPRPTHVEYMALPREARMAVSKLAALLRVADALQRSRERPIRDVVFRRDDAELTLSVPTACDLTLERKTIEAKADLFEDIYGLRVRLEEAPPVDGGARRAEPVD